MEALRVVVHGASGKMGQEVIRVVCAEPGLKLVGAVDLDVPQNTLSLPDGSGSVPFSSDLVSILKDCRPDVLVDFSIARAALPAARSAAKLGVHLVIGTSGLKPEEISEIDKLARTHQIGAAVVPNFAIGAVLMMYFSRIAARYFDFAEIVEGHHEKKVDSPSGTAIATARAMIEARGKPLLRPAKEKASGSRGQPVAGINIHSLRLPGLLARQEVLLGGPGETLSIKHNSISRQCFMPGVILAIKEIVTHKGLVYGLDSLLGLSGDSNAGI